MNTDEYVSIGTLAVALAALCVAVYEGWRARRHDRLSVRPLLEMEKQFDKKAWWLLLRNVGLGPAIIKSFDLSVDGSAVLDWQAVGERLGIPFYFEYASFHKDHAMPEGGNAYLIHLSGESDSESNRTILDAAICRLSVQISYVSMYGERMPTLTWAGSLRLQADKRIVN